MNHDQSVFLVSSFDDGRQINTITQLEKEWSEDYEVSSIQKIIYSKEDNLFYVLTNKHCEKLGIYIFKMVEKVYDPNLARISFIIKWNTKLNIGDCNMALCKYKD